MSLEEGVGISLINSLPEELLFASLKGLHANISLVSSSHKFSLSVHEIQVCGDIAWYKTEVDEMAVVSFLCDVWAGLASQLHCFHTVL